MGGVPRLTWLAGLARWTERPDDVALGHRPLWAILAGTTGGLVLVQTGFGAVAELIIGTPNHPHVLVCMAATGLLIAGLWLRSALGLLLLFPAALIAAFATMSPETLSSTYSAARWIPWLLSLLAFVLASSAWLSNPATEADGVERVPLGGRPGDGRSATTSLRIVGAVALLVFPSLALVLDSPSAHFHPERAAELLFAQLSLTFGWAIALYAFFIGPLLDAERDRRRLATNAEVPVTPRARRRRVAGWVALTLAIVGCVVGLLFRP